MGKAWIFRVRRYGQEALHGRPRLLSRETVSAAKSILAESRSPLQPSKEAAEFTLQAGKIQNLRTAAMYLHGLVIPRDEIFSFWRHVPRPTRSKGFTDGRELREGCIIPSVGGGLCQLSNALYDAALSAGFTIIERHAHSRLVPGSMAEAGRDATVFWNYVDLRFAPKETVQLEILLTRQDLIVRFRGLSTDPRPTSNADSVLPRPHAHREPVESCETCGITQCFRHPAAAGLVSQPCTAWVVDPFVPEFDEWMREHRQSKDWLLFPLDSNRFRFGSYPWSSRGFETVREARWATLQRSRISRSLASQGATRQRALLQLDDSMAKALASQLPSAATHLVISQNLLPFLWREGVLGGRTFDVFMHRLPLSELQHALDQAAQRFPQSRTLGDFRAPADILHAEEEALGAARALLTPHSHIAQRAGEKAVRLAWHIPSPRQVEKGEWIVFPASTLGRKGAYEMRAAAQALNLPIQLGGRSMESPEFWEGMETRTAGKDLLLGARAVVLPAWVEHQPRRLLQAVAAGVPVIASEACGLEGIAGVRTFPTGDLPALIAEMEKL